MQGARMKDHHEFRGLCRGGKAQGDPMLCHSSVNLQMCTDGTVFCKMKYKWSHGRLQELREKVRNRGFNHYSKLEKKP